MRSYSYFFQNINLNDSSYYNDWDFSKNKSLWDDPDPEVKAFWYSKDTTFLWKTVTYTIGDDQI